MAITIDSAPQKYTPSDNPCSFVFSSDQTTQDNFYFKVDTQLDGTTFTSHRVFPENGIYAHFDMQELTKSEIGLPTLNMTSNIEDALNEKSIRLAITEYYGTPPTAQSSVNTSTFSTNYAFKSRLDDLDWIDFDYTNKYFLTDFPQSEQYLVGYDEDLRILVINDGLADTITIELFDVNGASITSDTITTDNFGRINQIDLKPSTIVANTTITQANFDSAYYFEISTDAVGVTDTVKFYIDNRCGLYDSYRLIFASRLGGWEAFTFNLLSRDTTSTSGSQFNRAFGKWENNDFVYNKDDGRKQDYSTSSIDSLLVNSDWIKEDVQNWLKKNLYESPVVYIQSGTEFIRVNVKNKGGERKKRVNDMLLNDIIELEYSNNRKSFLG